MRLDRVVRRTAGQQSIRKIHRLIRASCQVNGKAVTDPAYCVVAGVDSITCRLTLGDDAPAREVDIPTAAFYVLNKPKGYVSQRHPISPNIYDLVPEPFQDALLVAFGRLDRDTTGLIVFGTDGSVQALVLSPTTHVWKTYDVTLDPASPLDDDARHRFTRGLALDDSAGDMGSGPRGFTSHVCAPAHLTIVDATHVQVRIREGQFHQVKRMISACGGKVVELHRSMFGTLSDEGLAIGSMRRLTGEELAGLIADSRTHGSPRRRPSASQSGDEKISE